MALDAVVQMINATVQIDQPQGDGTRQVGTGFLVQAPTPDGKPRVVLVTANHVLGNMPGPDARLHWRIADAQGHWHDQPEPLQIRSGGQPLWTRHPDQDVAAITVQAPPQFAQAAVPLAWLADEATAVREVRPGAALFTLGFPEGFAANTADFPILRRATVASYPTTPTADYPQFLIDSRAFNGNSGGPVFEDAGAGAAPVVTGMVTEQSNVNGRSLDLGRVTQTVFVREAIRRLDRLR